MAASNTELELAYADCRNITRREAKNFYYAVVTLPPDKRKAIYAAYAFCRHCDDAVDDGDSPEDKLSALAELQANLDQAYLGRPGTPEFLALSDTADRYAIPQEYFSEIIRGVESDLVKTRYQNFDELREYCYRVASVVGLVCLGGRPGMPPDFPVPAPKRRSGPGVRRGPGPGDAVDQHHPRRARGLEHGPGLSASG